MPDQITGVSVIPDWLQIVVAGAPLATLFAALIAGGVAVATLIQRQRADKRDQWWKRAQWAMDHAIEGELPAKVIGIRALKQLGRSELLAREEEEFLYGVGEAVQDLVIDSAAQKMETGKTKRWRRF